MIDLNQFVEWANEKKDRRSIEFKYSPHNPNPNLKVWVYDYDLMCGQRVASVAEINLENEKAKEEQEELKRLLAKYGQEGKDEANTNPTANL